MELEKELKDKYNVYYSNHYHAYVRTEGIWDRKNYELGKITELITGENLLTNGESYVDYKHHKEVGHICICGCPLCSILYRLYHKSSHICFLVGSKCITKAGHENFINDANCAKKNGICIECKCPLIIQGKRKNTDKKLINIIKICINCRKIKRYNLNINYHEKDVYKPYNTIWDSDNKVWYWKGYIDEMPKPLILKLKQ
jgi:hypothetical protein